MNISLDMPEKTGTTMAVNNGDDCTDIRPLFHKLLATETLDEDNKWFCESCKEKVIASKFSEFKSLPPALVIQLKRFRYDPVSIRNCYCCNVDILLSLIKTFYFIFLFYLFFYFLVKL